MDTNHQLRHAVEAAVVGRFGDQGRTVIVGDFVTVGEFMDEDGNLGLTLVTDARGNTPAQMMLQLLTHMAGDEGLAPVGNAEEADDE